MTGIRLEGFRAAACAVLLALVSGGCERPISSGFLAAPADSPEVFGEVGTFELVERSGSKCTREDLLGRPWVASFLFTRCSGPCPRVASTLRELQSRLDPGSALLVTFSVDPKWDTPEVLRKYAAELGADPQRWLFLTGDEKSIDELILESFRSGIARASAGEAPIGEHVSHRTQLVAVDKKGRIRGYYSGESDADLDLLVARLAHLRNEPD